MRAGALLAFGLVLWASGARADPAYLADLQQRAVEAHLADSRGWQVLLHYRRNALGHGVTSDADDPRFFLAPGGKTDPAAELAATLAAFFSSEPVGAEPQPAQCAFVARYAWLRQALGFDAGRLPEQRCEAFFRWKSELDAGAATLVFTSAYLNNPASLFGHTLLRLDRRDASAGTPLLAYAVSYAADDSGSTGLMYGIRGIAGGFTGYFELQSYDRLVRNYSDIENRDIWEYRLNLGAGQMDRLIAHLWELRGVKFDYYFFSENCAWQLLTLLEVADPSLALSDRFALWVAPPDVLRLINAEAGLVQGATPRPARGSAIRRRYAALDAPERAQAQAIGADLEHVDTPVFRALAPDRQALLLDLAVDLRQRGGDGPGKAGEGGVALPADEGLHRLLAARSALGPGLPSLAIAPYAGRPEAGHASHRSGLAVGQRAGEGFIELSARASFHDLLEADAGYAPEAAIELLGGSLRHSPGSGRTRLNELSLISIESLSPFNPLLPRPAWRARAGWVPAPKRDCPDCLVFRAQALAGLATETRGPWRILWFALPGLALEDGAGHPARAGPSINAGLIAEPLTGWKISAQLAHTAFRRGESSDEARWTLAQHYTLNRALAVRAAWKKFAEIREFSVGVLVYF
ncbi:MAG: DUF4105 domain-containing protein [Zoogloea sp.]|uniref:Lnb N-terminal periplasmic domain-containing protein n=1 Tax=Zoogloea sp. TaxID=49181 RepID=UPI002622A73D|nr:DUF4105 domain-containing protein [Zoogloea sp.]MDD2990681.1 DUF4105 domain-containing protein [Zoogloea sp.]